MAQQTIKRPAFPHMPPNTGDGPELGDSWDGVLVKLNAMFGDLYGRAGSPAGMSRGAVLGASLESNAWNAPTWTNGGWVAWLRRYSKGAVDLPSSRIFAAFGYTSTQIINTFLTPLIAAKPAWCFVDVSNNDFRSAPSDITAAIPNLQTIIAQLQANNIYPILVPCRMLGAGAPWNATQILQVGYINQWMKSYCEQNSGITYWDVNPPTIDFATGNALANLVIADNIHDSTQGAQIKGLSAWNLISSILPARDSRFVALGDTYDATNNRTGNLLTNGLLAGTGGTIGGTIVNTGQLAANWSTLGGATNTPAVSKTAYGSSLTNLFKQTISFSGTGDGGNFQIYQQLSNWSIGDTLTAQCETDWNITSGSFTGIYCQLLTGTGANLGSDGLNTNYGDYTIAAGQSILLRTDPTIIPAGTATLYFVMGVQIGNIAMGGAVNFARASCRKS